MASTTENTPRVQATPRGQEPAMYLQRPSTGRSQDIRHILARAFRDLYTREAVRPETVKNLQVSKGGDDPYHERYVDRLQKVYDEWKRRMEEAAMLERHIMQAQARAMSADERDIHRSSKSCSDYDKLGLPPGRAHFRSCIDTTLLRDHHLLTPEDYSTEEPASVPPPSGPSIPQYARETLSSQQHSRQNLTESQPLHPVNVKPGESMDFPSFLSDVDTMEDDDYLALRDQATEEKFPSAQAWKTYMGTDQRQIDRSDLAQVDAKVSYKRNPRYLRPAEMDNETIIKPSKKKAKQINIQSKPEKQPEDDSPIFLASPPEVIFKDYKVGQVYEITLELKNVSTVMRQCRAYPPKSSYFSVGLGQFPGEKGLVAPGMSCHFPIRFAPDSLKDYEDEIIIHTQSSKQMVISIQGRREPPCLTIPPQLDVGRCLVRGYQVTQFAIRNEGGPGRFCIMPRSAWPATNFKTVIQNGSVMLPPFELRPSTLELDRGQVTVIEVMFRPTVTREYFQEFTILCDNCHAQHFTLKGEGETVKITLDKVERGESAALPGELCDRSAQHLIKFDDLNPFTYTERTISVRNHTNIELPFQWMVYKPQMPKEPVKALTELVGEAPPPQGPTRDPEDDRVPELDSVFSVHPPNGVLELSATTEFRVTFAPPVISDFHNVIHLLVQQVPPATPATRATMSDTGGSSPEETGDEMTELGPSDGSGSKETVPTFHDMTALEVELKGRSIPLNVVLHPYAMFLPGSYLVGNTTKRLFTMANHSFSTITFQWEPVHNDKMILEVEPPFGELDPGMAMDLELSVTGTQPGHISHTLYCFVLNMEEPLHLHVDTTIKGPEVTVDEPSLNFGLVRMGDCVEKELTLTSMAQIITKWSLQDKPLALDAESSDAMACSEFKFLPDCGELRPLEKKTVTVQFTPTGVKTVQRTFVLEVEDGNTVSVGAFAEVQQPMVCLLECDVKLPEVYVGVPVVFNAVIFNQTLLPTIFEWGKAEGAQASECDIDIDQPAGGLHSREKHSVRISFCALRPGDFSEVRLPCSIRGQEALLFLNISCEAQSLAIKYKTSSNGQLMSDDMSIDAGEDVALGEPVKRYLYICNQTAIATNFTVDMEMFSSAAPTSAPGQETHRQTSSGRALLARTPNLADPLSKTPSKCASDFKVAVLGKGLGAAFLLQPSSGSLPPFGEQEIEVTAYSDMWGKYCDNIISKVGDHDPVKIPISMTVKGCPLNFQMTAANPDQSTVLRFGTLVAGTAPVTRHIRVNNISPIDIRVDWKVFNQRPDDEKLVDLVVAYGRSFPLRDADGVEVIPSTPEPPRVPRAPTEEIPDSPDTTSSEMTPPAPMKEAEVESRLVPHSAGSDKKKERPKVVSLYLRAHDGEEGFAPYNIQPRQLTIPAKGHATVLMTFTPPPAEEVMEERDCVCFALGYLSLDGESANVSGKVERLEAYETKQLRIDYTCHVKPALLTIEETDDEGMNYRSAMSDILHGDKVLPESLQTRSLMLSNSTQTPLTFRLKVNAPFLMVDLDGGSRGGGGGGGSAGAGVGAARTMQTGFHTLQPRHNIMVKVALRVTPSMLADYQKEQGAEDWERVTSEHRLDIRDHLVIDFNNTTQQKVALQATVAIPQMALSKSELDFGTCLVGQRRQLQLLISNDTASHCTWSASFESKSATCVQDTFQISPTHGQLDAYITHVSNSKTLLSVYFTAKHAESYEAVILFQGMLGEAHQRLYVRGRGSYDGKHEAVLNA
ncbi:deleted in lung and esophageal cancer protein 1-like isoform X2 [Babylonia areolata]|uniref:deleted in lung and esophageal cancer protein 1-like isoform X2 n=1 Tax=Babylonia areolata TaxID=304850 RepID=UPI003FD07188